MGKIEDKTGRYRVESEVTDTHCGFDFESFLWGWDCPQPATKVIIEGAVFHYAHLCEEHIVLTMWRLVNG